MSRSLGSPRDILEAPPPSLCLSKAAIPTTIFTITIIPGETPRVTQSQPRPGCYTYHRTYHPHHPSRNPIEPPSLSPGHTATPTTDSFVLKLIMGGLGYWVIFWGNFFKNFQAKNMPRNNQFSVFLPRKGKKLPQIKICPISLKIYPRTQHLPSHRVLLC